MGQNRRNFIRTAATATSAFVIPVKSVFSEPAIANSEKLRPFDLQIFATDWGFKGTFSQFCEKVKEAGYDGIEIWWSNEKKKQEEVAAALKKYDLNVGFLWGSHDKDYATHYKEFIAGTDTILSTSVRTPLYINCHSGKDYFTFDQNKKLIEYTNQASAKSGILICHETHRSRMLFAAPLAKQYLLNYPDLKITFDVSHWCNVSESYLHDQEETVSLAIDRAEHIHARVGHPEGPQVSDPRAPEWKPAVDAHFAWWDRIVDRKKREGKRLTILAEFGPPAYLPTLPYTQQPVADQWEINLYMMQLLRKRYL